MTAPTPLGRDAAVQNASLYRCTECRATAQVEDTVSVVHASWCLRAARLRVRKAATRPGEVRCA